MSKNGRDDEAEPAGVKTESDKDKDDSGKINGLQVAAATGAATTAAMVANALGIYGTVTGVAVFSIVSSVGTVVYLKSMRHTKAKFDKVVKNRDTVVMRARNGGGEATVVTLSAAEPDPDATRPVSGDLDATRPLAAATPTAPIDPNAKATGTAKMPTAAVAEAEPEPTSVLARSTEFLRRNWRPIAASSLIVFVLTVGLLTSIALLAGKPATSFYDANPGPVTTTSPDSPSEGGDGGSSEDTSGEDGTPSDQPSTSSEPDQPSSPESTSKQPSPSTSESEQGGEGEGDGDLKPTPSAEDDAASRQ